MIERPNEIQKKSREEPKTLRDEVDFYSHRRGGVKAYGTSDFGIIYEITELRIKPTPELKQRPESNNINE